MMISDPRFLSGLPVLVAVIESKSFVRAGEALGLTQSGVSRAIQRLEERLGIRIFERTSKMVRLTEEGNRFCKEALPLFSQLEELAGEVQNASGIVRGLLRVNVDPTFSRLFLAPRIGDFLTAHPALRMELVIRDRLGDLVADGFDAAIRFGEPEPSGLIVRRLLQVRVLTCAAPSYLKRRGKPSAPQELQTKNHECLLFRDSVTGQPFPWEFHRAKQRNTVGVKGQLVLNDALTQLDACVAGCGVAQVFDLDMDHLLKSGKLLNLFPDWSDEMFPLCIYHASRRNMPLKLRTFIDFIVASIKTHGG
ncbi:MAG TPA: LysR family transcriptional regulator [Phycisphaerae bacterium]|nr:LysR family transcriptional regulator [Phycisphaerae bacterium]